MTPGEPIMRKALLRAATAAAKARGQTQNTISLKAYGDSRFLGKLAAGRASIPAGKFDKAMAWFGNRSNYPNRVVPPEVADIFSHVKL